MQSVCVCVWLCSGYDLGHCPHSINIKSKLSIFHSVLSQYLFVTTVWKRRYLNSQAKLDGRKCSHSGWPFLIIISSSTHLAYLHILRQKKCFSVFYLFKTFIEFRMWRRHLFTLEQGKKNGRKIDNQETNLPSSNGQYLWMHSLQDILGGGNIPLFILHSPFGMTYSLSFQRFVHIFDMHQLASISLFHNVDVASDICTNIWLAFKLATNMDRIEFRYRDFYVYTVFKRLKIIPTYLLNGRTLVFSI